MSEQQSINFDDLKPVKGAGTTKLKTFTVIGKELTEKQRKAGYYLQVNVGDKIDGIFNGITRNTRGDYPSDEVSMLGLDGSETIVKAGATLKAELSSIEVGTPVRLIFNGTKLLTKGPGKGKQMELWSVNS